MADGPASTIVFDGNSTGAVAALHAVDVAAKNTAAAVQGTGAALSKVGDGADAGVEKAVNATKRFEAQLKRLNLELESGGRNTAAYIEGRAKMAGADTAALAPLLAQYDQIKAKQALANAEFTKSGKIMTDYGMGVKATSAALRQVPAQFTDIIVSLQGGQAPLTVLLQQGGQLKDVFGGVGNAFKALSSYVLGLVNPFSLAAVAAGTLAVAYTKGAAESEAYNKSLIMTGNTAGTTAGRLSDMAKSVAEATGGTVGGAAEALAQLAGTSGVAAAQFERVTSVATQMQKVAGVAVSDTIKQFAELGKDPVKASEKLNESTHYLTAEIYHQIKALEDQGDKLGAAALAQSAYADAMNQRIPDLAKNLSLLERAWLAIIAPAKQAWGAMLNIGREEGPAEKIAEIQAKIADSQKNRSYNPMMSDAQVFLLKQELEYWQRIEASQRSYSNFQKESAVQAEASIALAKEADKYASKQVQMEREIAKARDIYNNSPKSVQDTANYESSLVGIQKRFAETEKAAKSAKKVMVDAWDKSVINEYAQAMDKLYKVQLKAEESAEGLSKTQTALREVQTGPQWAKFSRQQQEQIIYSAALSQGAEDQAAAQKLLDKAIEDTAKQWKDYQEQQAKAIVSADDEVAKAQASYDAHGKLASVLQEEAVARLEVARAQIIGTEDTSVLDAQIAAKRKLIDVLRKGEARDAVDDLAKANQKAAEESSKYWEDALMRAFESGKGFFQSLWDTIKNTLKTQVLKVLIAPVSGAISGYAAAATTGAASSAGTSMLGGLAGSSMSSLTMVGAQAAATLSNGIITGFSTNMSNIAGLAANGQFAGALGSALPYIGIALAGVSLIKGLLNNDAIASQSTGGAAISYDASGNITKTEEHFLQVVGGGINDTVQKSIDSLYSSYSGIAKSLGIGTVAAAFSIDGNTGKDGKDPQFAIGSTAGGQSYSIGETKLTEEAFALAASRAVFTALQGSELPGYLSKVFDGITASTATQDQINQAIAYAGSLKTIRDAMLETREPLQIIKDNVAAATAALATSADTFKTDFVAAIDAGISPDKLAAWQALGAGLDALKQAADETAEVAKTAAEALAKTNQGWQDQIDVLTGATTEREIALRDTTEATTRALMRQVWAQEDLKSATDSTIESYNAIMDSAASIRAAVAGVGTSVSDSIFGMQYGLEDNAGKYNMLDVKGARLEDQMFASNDIYAIAQLAQDQISLINQAWALLDPEQQKAQILPFEDKLNTISDFVMQKGADPVALAKAQNEATAKAIAEAVKAAIAEAMADPTSALAQAAADVKAAANTPAQVNVNSHITVTAPAGSEVSVA